MMVAQWFATHTYRLGLVTRCTCRMGREILTVKVAFTAVNLKAGYRVAIPKEIYIPGGGYLIVAKRQGRFRN